MSSSYSDILRLEKQADGENSTTWGQKVNTVFEMIEDSIAGMATIATTGGSTTLTTNNSATDEARMALLKITGTLVSNATITIPATTKKYIVWNATSGAYTVTVKTSGGTGAAISQGAKTHIFCDGTDTYISGIANFTDAANTAAPNATVPVVSLTATNAATNVDAAVVPKGTGAFALAVADNTAAGGNKRGTGAIDLQCTRGSAAQVASGAYSFAAGSSNTTSGQNSVACGSSNITSNSFAVAFGFGNTVSGSYAFAQGASNTASGSYAFAQGSGNIASGSFAFAQGSSNTASGIYAFCVGFGGVSAQISKFVIACGGLFAGQIGSVQSGKMVIGVDTTGATPSVLTSSIGAADTTNQLILSNNSAMAVKGTIICRRSVTQANEACGWEFKGIIRRGANAAATALVGAITPTLIATDAALATASIAITADTTNGGLAVTATGIAATNLHWVCVLESAETIFA